MNNRILFKDFALLLAALITALFWIIGSSMDVYAYTALGAFYELASLPMLVLGIGVVLASAWLLFHNTGRNKIWPLLSLTICMLAIAVMVLK